MATSSVSGMLNNQLRVTGLSSGLDIDSLVEKLMSVESTKVNKVIKSKTLMEWKRDDYRSIISKLQDLSSTYFDVTKPSTNLRSATAFSSHSATYDGSSTSSYLTATPSSTATSGTYKINSVTTAKVASAEGTANVTAAMTGAQISSLAINANSDNNKITVTFNGTSKEITLVDNPGSYTALRDDLQTKLNSAFGKYSNGSAKITVGLTGTGSDQLTFSTSGTNILSIGNAYNSGNSVLLGASLSAGITLDASNNKFKLTLDSTTSEIALDMGTYANTDAVLAQLQSKIDAVPAFNGKVRVVNQNDVLSLKAIGSAGSATGSLSTADVSGGATIDASNKSMDITLDGVTKTITLDEKNYTKKELLSAIQSKMDSAFGSNKGMVSVDGANHLRFESISTTSTVSTAARENGGLSALGLANVNQSNKIDLTANLSTIVNKFSFSGGLTIGTADADGYDMRFSINGELFKFKSSTTSLNAVMSTVNANTAANVTMKYDSVNDKFTIESKDMGVTAAVNVTEADSGDGNLMAALGLKGKNAIGSDAEISIDGVKFVRSSNSFTINNVAYTLKADTNTEVSMSVGSDPTKVVELVKGFVSKYNEIIDQINSKLVEKRYRDYTPLTDDQKSAMKEGDIELWEGKAKSGLLRSDSVLSGIVNNMRKALSDSISDVGVSLSSIGIQTGTYSDKGKLYIDEDKLTAAVSENSDEVVKLFTKDDSGYSYKDASNDATKKAARYNASGIGQRLYDIIQDNIRVTRDSSGQKGTLIEKVGIIGDTSEFTSSVYKQISDFDEKIADLNERLIDLEERYYAKFSAMETALQKMNSQGSWLSSQLGQS